MNATYNYFNGLSSVFGVVQVCVDQQFVYVCSDGWDDREAQVACRTYNGNYRPPYYGVMITKCVPKSFHSFFDFSIDSIHVHVSG